MIQFRQPDQNFGWNIALTKLVIAVYLLRTIQILRKLPLFQIAVFPQIAYTLIQAITSKI